MRDHDDEPVVRDLLQEIHDLLRSLGVKRAGRFVRENDLRIVDDGARYRHALHLSAGHLVGFLPELTAEPHAFERVDGELPLFLARYAGDGEGKLDVLQHVEVRDEVVGLKNEPYRTVAVGVPVTRFELFGGFVVDDEVAVRVLVKTADDVEQGGLAAAGGTENGNEFAFAEIQADALDRMDDGIRHAVIFDNVDEFKHTTSSCALSRTFCPHR